MKFFLKPTDPLKLKVDTLVAFCFEDEFEKFNLGNKEIDKIIKESAAKEDFEAKDGQFLELSGREPYSFYKLLIIGAGNSEKFDIFKFYKVAAFAVDKLKSLKLTKTAVRIDNFFSKFDAEKVIQVMVEVIKLSFYHFIKYKSEEEKKKIREIEEVYITLPPHKIPRTDKALEIGQIYADATCFARDLVNEPAMVTTPSYLADVAKTIEKESKRAVKVDVFEKEKIEKFGMGAYLGVSKGSSEPPKFIRLSYKGRGSKKRVILVGKGITFDTGGLSLKESKHMETMKIDMAGAAAVLAVFSALPKLDIRCEVIGLIAACENMPGGRALKPGDILKTASGKTIEILNTDAEGRLTLADTFSYALNKEKPDIMIDLATLTGACMVALGENIAGLWGNNTQLLEAIKEAATISAEKVWIMPLEEDYKELIKSDIADIRNTSKGKYGGAITASLFLAEFVGKTPWVHLDIAGPAYEEKGLPLFPKGGSGFGVRLILSFLSTF